MQILKSLMGDAEHIAFIGMSEIGKTYWSERFSKEFGTTHFEFDELIGNSPEMKTLLKNIDGKDDAARMGKYFGMPWTNGFQNKEEHFLDIEKQMLKQSYPVNSILDLTGSSIYCPEEMEELVNTSFIIYLETSEDKQEEMFEKYIQHPKPVCWGGIFQARNKESEDDALKRCYPLLLSDRSKLYKQYADVTVPHEIHQQCKTVHQLSEWIINHFEPKIEEHLIPSC